MASIRDVAKLAGVSPSTVSRVMNGTVHVDDDKRTRVLRAINETGFKPNELARALYKQSSRIIGIIVPNIENPFFNELAKAVEEEAYKNQYKILLCNSNNNTEKEFMNIQMLAQMKADGIIIVTNSGKTGQMLENCQLPVIVVDRQFTDYGQTAFVEADHYKGGKMAVSHLIGCGCKKIVFLRGPLNLSSGLWRYRGYHEICSQYGVQERCIDCLYDYEDGLRAAKELLGRYPDTDGIVASNDMVAIAAYKILSQNGYRVPEDIQIIGFDNIQFSWLFTPELTTVIQPIKEMGTLAVQIILKHRKGLPFQEKNVLDVSLVERQTTKRKE